MTNVILDKHRDSNSYKRVFGEMIFIKKERDTCLNKVTDIDNLNTAYNMIIESIETNGSRKEQRLKCTSDGVRFSISAFPSMS